MAGLDTTLNIISLNVHGIRGKNKRKSLFRELKSQNYDIVALQETYLTENDKNMLELEWGGKVHLSEGTNHSKGIVTLFSKKIDNFEISEVSKSNRVLISEVTSHNQTIYVTNVYGPREDTEKIIFLENIKQKIYDIQMSKGDINMILLGDLNVVKDNTLDIVSGRPHSVKTVDMLNKLLDELDLFDCWRIQNPDKKMYTWCKHNPFIARRLDYIFINTYLLPFCIQAGSINFGLSDHRAVSIKLDFTTFKRGPSTYKMNVNILNDLEFINYIKCEILNAYSLKNDLNPHDFWEYIKIIIRSSSISYSKNKAHNRKNRKGFLQDRLHDLEMELSSNPSNTIIETEVLKLKHELELITINDTRGAIIRSRQKWVEEGEKCNKFFLGLEKSKGSANTIYRINDQGRLITGSDPILNFITKHYEDMYTESNPINKELDISEEVFLNQSANNVIPEHDIKNLENDISEQEVLNALKAMKNGSAPGLDGIPIECYKVLWHDIKVPLMECFKYSFSQQILSDSQRQGMICLLHKGKHLDRDNISNWRPITLCNSDYKLIAKLMALRLQPVLDIIISPDQNAFIKGRNGSNMIREIDDIIELGKVKNSDNLIFSADYAKAFDTLSTKAMVKALKFHGFPEAYINWIKTLLKERISVVRNGGYVSKYFKISRGIRQGCPISPMIFILTLELLAINIRNDESIQGISLPNRINRTKIKLFADDVTYFLKNTIDFREVLSKIKLFAVFSGLELNMNKSKIMYLKPNVHQQNINEIEIVDEIKILGVYFSIRKPARLLDKNFDDKITQLEKLFGIWGKRNLTILGKIIVIKTYGLSKFVHIMQSIGIPETVLKRINTMFFQFLWQQNKPNTKITEKVKRKVVINKIKDGGLNMIDIVAMQKSFYLHWVERLLSPEDTEWKSIPLYSLEPVGGKSVFRCNVTNKEFKGLNYIQATFWRLVLETWLEHRQIEHEQNKQDLVNANSTIFNNKWITFKNNTLFIPQYIKAGILTINDSMNSEGIISFEDLKTKFKLKNEQLLNYNVIYNALLPHIQSVIENKSKEGLNKLEYRDLEIGKIGRKRFYSLIIEKQTPHVEESWTKIYNQKFDNEIWRIPSQATSETKLISLQWKILHMIYPTNTLLNKMGIKDTNVCAYCNEIDTLEHFFFECNIVYPVWDEISKTIRAKTGQRVRLDNSKVIFGCKEVKGKKSQTNFTNVIILVGKLVINKFKFGKPGNLRTLLEYEIRLRKLNYIDHGTPVDHTVTC